MTEYHLRGEPMTRAEYERVKGVLSSTLGGYDYEFPAVYESKVKFDKIRVYVELYKDEDENATPTPGEEEPENWETIITNLFEPFGVESRDIKTREISAIINERVQNPVLADGEDDGFPIYAFRGVCDDVDENTGEVQVKCVDYKVVTFFFETYKVEILEVKNPYFAAFFDSYDGLLGSLLYRVCMGKGLVLNREGLFVQYEIPTPFAPFTSPNLAHRLFPLTRCPYSARNYLLGGDRTIISEKYLIAWVRESKLFNVRGFFYYNPLLLEAPIARERAERLGAELREKYTSVKLVDILWGNGPEKEDVQGALTHFGVKRAYELVLYYLEDSRRECKNIHRLRKEIERLENEYVPTWDEYAKEQHYDPAKEVDEEKLTLLRELYNSKKCKRIEALKYHKDLLKNANFSTAGVNFDIIRNITDMLLSLDHFFDAKEPIPDLFETFAQDVCGNKVDSIAFERYLGEGDKAKKCRSLFYDMYRQIYKDLRFTKR